MIIWQGRENTMTHSDFNHLRSSINALSPDQMRQLIDELQRKMAATGRQDAPPPADDEESPGQDIQQRLFAAGVVREIKPPIRDLTPYRNRKAVPITGEPLSETVIRDRR
jgi:hypothetical protein